MRLEKMATRYDTGHLTEAHFEPGSRGCVLKNHLGIRSKREMDALEATKLADVTDWAIRHATVPTPHAPQSNYSTSGFHPKKPTRPTAHLQSI